MANSKQTKISFRLDDVRTYKMVKYQSSNKINNKNMNNTQFMLRAIDNLLEDEESELQDEIEKYESVLIEIILGMSKRNFSDEEEYLNKLKESIERIENAIKYY